MRTEQSMLTQSDSKPLSKHCQGSNLVVCFNPPYFTKYCIHLTHTGRCSKYAPGSALAVFLRLIRILMEELLVSWLLLLQP